MGRALAPVRNQGHRGAHSHSEDDGFVVGFVYDKTTDLSDFVVLDAQNFSEAPLARITLPQRVPFGFHGSWINLD